jgi:hypothetical protein
MGRFLNARLLICLCLAVALTGCASEQRKFSTPDAAVNSLVDALRANNTSQLKKLFGPDGGEIVSSGDPVADRAQADQFLAAYDAQHRLQAEADGKSTILVGPKDWPFPVPIVKSDGQYVFDSAAGKDEILNRRIGRNELATEVVCLAIVDAQRDYVALRPMGGDLPRYAKKIVSDPGQKNGLYWPTAEGETPSPLGPLVAAASAEGYGKNRDTNAAPPPYHGYRYGLLTSQGPNAPGGEEDYLINGELIGGFGVVAYPADYGNSGIMTFITNHDGVVYQCDLGEDTESIAKAMKRFDPGAGWTKCADPDKAAAAIED